MAWKAFALEKLGQKEHVLNLHHLGTPFHVLRESHEAHSRISRRIDFSNLGIYCASNTTPCVKELHIVGNIGDQDQIELSKDGNHTIGYDSDQRRNKSIKNAFKAKIDFTKKILDKNDEARMPILETGKILYPFNMIEFYFQHSQLHSKYQEQLCAAPTNDPSKDAYRQLATTMIAENDLAKLDQAYIYLSECLKLDVLIVLDNNQILSFTWNQNDEIFNSGFYNFGLTAI